MNDEQIEEESLYYISQQSVSLDPLDEKDLILDIGGGGEGIIGQLNGRRVISIDLDLDELLEAPSKSQKVLMDARKMSFLSGSLKMATSFFTLMYIPREDRREVFEEVYRILSSGGKFEIWDVDIPECKNDKEVFVVPIEVKLPQKSIRTGYGVSWEERQQSLEYYLELAFSANFEVVKKERQDRIYHLVLKKGRRKLKT